MANILITGCSTGIGKETALLLARAGHQVIATMRDPSRGADLTAYVAKENLPLMICPLDVDHDESVKKAIDQILRDWGHLDVLVNNAGIAPLGHVEETPMSTFKQTMETNFFGAIRCIQAVLAPMRNQGGGTIINVSSVSGRLASSPYAAYTASKHALEAMSECLAQEVRAHNIRIANIEPGFVETPILDKQGQPPANSIYPQWKRLNNLLRVVRQNPTEPLIAATMIKEIIETDSWQLRHPIGPDAEPFLAWRRAMSDEEWIDLGGAADDEEWYSRMERDFGINARN